MVFNMQNIIKVNYNIKIKNVKKQNFTMLKKDYYKLEDVYEIQSIGRKTTFTKYHLISLVLKTPLLNVLVIKLMQKRMGV